MIYTVSSGGSVDVISGMDTVYPLADTPDFENVSDDTEIDFAADESLAVIIRTRSGKILPFLPIIDSVVEMWREELSALAPNDPQMPYGPETEAL